MVLRESWVALGASRGGPGGYWGALGHLEGIRKGVLGGMLGEALGEFGTTQGRPRREWGPGEHLGSHGWIL